MVAGTFLVLINQAPVRRHRYLIRMEGLLQPSARTLTAGSAGSCRELAWLLVRENFLSPVCWQPLVSGSDPVDCRRGKRLDGRVSIRLYRPACLDRGIIPGAG